ncbi:hypothetical protein [Roseiarcus fermentans]|nr:hypothetical protein [Roseiarcus fermentans]
MAGYAAQFATATIAFDEIRHFHQGLRP